MEGSRFGEEKLRLAPFGPRLAPRPRTRSPRRPRPAPQAPPRAPRAPPPPGRLPLLPALGRGPGDSGSRRRGRSMGRFRGGLRCIKYLLLGFNLLFWVRPGAKRAGQGRGRAGWRDPGPRGADRCGVRAGLREKAGCSKCRR